MMIPKVNPAQMALIDVVLPEVKSFAEQMLDDRKLLAANSSPTAPEDALTEMIRITTFEMVKNEIFYPEVDEEVDW